MSEHTPIYPWDVMLIQQNNADSAYIAADPNNPKVWYWDTGGRWDRAKHGFVGSESDARAAIAKAERGNA